MKLRCRHKWLQLSFEAYRGKTAGTWWWCYLCGATKHTVDQKDYFGLDKNGVYIRHVGCGKKAKLVRSWNL